MAVRSIILLFVCILAAAPAIAADDPKPYTATGKPEDRDYWTKDADQHWEKVAEGKWVEIVKDKKYNWVEKDSNKQYIEMSDASRNLTIRLSDDGCTWVRDAGGGKTQLQRLYPGKWGKTDVTSKPPDTSKSPPLDSSKSSSGSSGKGYTATGKPEDRDYWTKDADQHWEKVAEGKWVEITKDAKYDWVEKKNTTQFIELEDSSRNLTIRLSDDACTWVRGPKKLERLYPGKWGKTETTTKTPDDPKPVGRAKAQWVDSLEKMKFPEGMVAGKLNGLDFEPSEVTYNLDTRELRFTWKPKDSKAILPDLELTLDLPNVGNKAAPIKKGQVPEGVTLKRNFRQNITDYMLRIVPQDRTPNNKTGNGVLAVGEWAYIIEYTGKQGDKLAGKIYMCSGDEKKHFLAGSFEATIVK